MERLREEALTHLRWILVIQLGPFGDALLTTSYFETLKKRLPEARICYLIKEPYDAMVRDHPFIDRLMVIAKRSGPGYLVERVRIIRSIRRQRFDLVIDQQNMPSSQQLVLLSRARYRLGYRDARFSWVYNLKAGRGRLRYSASRKFDILGPLGIQEEPYRLCFRIPDEAQRYVDDWLRAAGQLAEGLICISPGSPVEKKKWGPGNYAALADMIQTSLKQPVVLVWGPGELADIEAVRSKMRTEPLVAPPTDLRQAAALLRRCGLLVCNDGGLNHLAVATGTASLAIFGDTDPTDWSPASVFPHHHHLHRPGSYCAGDDSFGISPEMAFEEVRRITGSGGEAGR